MNKKLKKLATLISASFATNASNADVMHALKPKLLENDSLSVSLLNQSVSQILAAHRSHSSHGSHGSHRSSSGGGGYVAPSTTPSQSQTKKSTVTRPKKQADPLGQAPRPKSSYPPNQSKDLTSTLKDKEKRKNIIMRMQLALQFEGLYGGAVDGILGPKTRAAILAYKKSKGISGEKVLDAKTLNAFGILGF